jgi:predicted phage terminase large subunit-like protein
LRLEIPQQLIPLAQHIRSGRYRHIIVKGGRGSGKSWSIARILVANCLGHGLRILCLRESQKSIKLSSKLLIADQIEAMGLSQAYEVQDQQILMRNGKLRGEFQFTGMKEHTSDSFKSYESFDIAWVEEASSVTDVSANKLIPTIRKPGSLLVWSYNPDQESDFVHQLAKSGRSDVLVIDCNWEHNPWFPQELETERVAMLNLNQDLYAHIWGGQCRSAAGLLFKRIWFADRWTVLPKGLNNYIASDYAAGQDPDKPESNPDWTEHGVAGLGPDGHLYVHDWWYGQDDPTVWINELLRLAATHKPLRLFEEKGPIHRSLDPFIKRAMIAKKVIIARTALQSDAAKAERALGFAAMCAAGMVHFPADEQKYPWVPRVINQLCAFNGQDGRDDDAVDVLSLLARGMNSMANGGLPEAIKPKTMADYVFDGVDDDPDNWKTA